ncbi:hypothetical protein MTO96_035535 [Rhipicephalus appendiculatus]
MAFRFDGLPAMPPFGAVGVNVGPNEGPPVGFGWVGFGRGLFVGGGGIRQRPPVHGDNIAALFAVGHGSRLQCPE